MALPGELNGLEGTECDCGSVLPLKVCRSAAGYYLGYHCDECGPWSRETGYFRTEDEAKAALVQYQQSQQVPVNVRDLGYHG